MYVAGQLSRKAERLIQVTHDALFKGIDVVKPGKTFGDIGHAIQTYAKQIECRSCGIFAAMVWEEFSCAAKCFTLWKGRNRSFDRRRYVLYAIEPMVNWGRPETKVLSDEWTAVTRDKSLSAQFEHSIGVTKDGAEIFTLSPKNKFHPTYS